MKSTKVIKGEKPPMTEARILDVSNDISEGIDNGQTVEQLREVCRYWMNATARAGALRGNQLAHVANCALQMMTEHKERRVKKFVPGPSVAGAFTKYRAAWGKVAKGARGEG